MNKKLILKKVLDGKGGPFDGLSKTVGKIFGGNTITAKVKEPTTYDLRGVKVSDEDFEAAAPILYAEVSNRQPDKQNLEIHNIINTAINRSLSGGPDKGKSLKDVLQRKAQYQGYAPEGTTSSSGKIIPSQYQKAVKGNLQGSEEAKMKIIRDTLNEIKTKGLNDTTKGAIFYVHASDGTIWTGKTQREALNNASKHEKVSKIAKTKFGTRVGMPAQLSINKN